MGSRGGDRNDVQSFPTGLIPIERSMSLARGSGWTAVLQRTKSPSQGREERREIVIRSRSKRNAQQALNLILDAHRLLSGEPPPWQCELEVRASRDAGKNEAKERTGLLSFSTNDFPCA